MTNKEFRCTRQAPYPVGSFGHKDLSARQGYYIMAASKEAAEQRMSAGFPEDVAAGFDFDIQEWGGSEVVHG